jgi:colanic acid/amylovoran biosynthesis glycosyltransferase
MEQPIIAIVSPNKEALSESFIKAHKELIGFPIKYLYGGFFPILSEDGLYDLNSKKTLLNRIFLSILRRSFLFTSHPLEKYLKNQKVRLVLAEYGQTGSEMAIICSNLHIPLIVHFHGYDAYQNEVLKEYDGYKLLFSMVDFIIAVSTDMVSKLNSLGAPIEKIVLNPCGPQSVFTKIHPNYNSNIILALGRFVDKKAPYLTIEAFRQAHQKNPLLKLVIGGIGPLLNTCKNLVIVWKIESSVVFLEEVPHQEIPKLMNSAFCFIQHSITADNGDSEGTPVAILEASAAGLPVVATQHAGIKDTIIHGETGFLVPEKDVAGMAAYIIQLDNDRSLCASVGLSGKKRIMKEFSIERHIQSIEALILKVTN